MPVLTQCFCLHWKVHSSSSIVLVTGERLFGLQMSLLTVCFICRNGHAGFWDKKKGLVWRLFFIFILASAPWTWKAKKRLSLIPFKCPHYDGQSWLLRRCLMLTSPLKLVLALSSRLLFVFPVCSEDTGLQLNCKWLKKYTLRSFPIRENW